MATIPAKTATRKLTPPKEGDIANRPIFPTAANTPQTFVQPYRYYDLNTFTAPGASLPARQNLAGTLQQMQLQNIPVADGIYNIGQGLGNRDAAAQTYLDLYGWLFNTVNQEFAQNGLLNDDLHKNDLAALDDQYRMAIQAYWPEGQLAQMQNQYFINAGNSLANQSNTSRVNASQSAGRAGLSRNAQSILANQAGNQYLKPQADLFKSQTEAADNLLKSRDTVLNKIYDYRTGSNDKYLKDVQEKQMAERLKITDALTQLLANNEGVNKTNTLMPIIQKLMNDANVTAATGTSGKSNTPYTGNAVVSRHQDLINQIKR